MSLNITGDDFNAPTNPQLVSTTADFSDGDRVYTGIVSHGAVSISITGFGGAVTEYSNLITTKGFRIKCYDALTTTGLRFNPADWDATTGKFTTNDYFVLVYSDSPFQHHFAKITEVKTEDEVGDAFEFTPKLGNEIPKDTKFIIFEVTKNTDIVAISLGMLQDSTQSDYINQLARRMSVARPLFYFYDLDKEGELNHNTKYFAMRECGTANTYTLSNSDPSITFLTIEDFGQVITDYSKFSHRITLTDNLKVLDETNTATNEGSTGLASDGAVYDQTFRNARRISDDEITSPVYTGPTRYMHYDFSPTKSNLLYNVYEHVNTESIDGKGGFAETSIIDNGRIIQRKIKEFYSYRVRNFIHRGEVNEFFPLEVTYGSKTSNAVFSFETQYDLDDVLNAGDEVKLGDNILIVQSIASLSGTTQEITFQSSTHPYTRTENDGVFTAQSTTPSSGEVLHRRAYNATDGTLMLDLSLLNNRFSKMYVAFTSLNNNERFATVTACDSVKNMITLSFEGESYNSNPLSFLTGQYQLFIERFNGEIENIESKKQDSQTIVEIQGRDKFNKLLSPVVNLNSLFTEDIIYSSNSPYNKLTSIKSGASISVSLNAGYIDTGITNFFSSFDTYPSIGDKLFTVNGYIGEVIGLTLHATVNLRILITNAITAANSEEIYIDTEKNYVLSKALGSSYLATNKPTSLTGAANKGLIFTSGNTVKGFVLNATTTVTSATVNISALGESTSNLEAGMLITGHSRIPDGTTIVSVDSPTAITISQSAAGSGSEICEFSKEDISLVSTSANINEGAIGYAINKPSSISNDLAFQSLLKDEHGSAGKSSFDTVNTLIDFEVVSTTTKEGKTEIELAPYMPIAMGRKIENHFNTEDVVYTSIGTIAAIEYVGASYSIINLEGANTANVELGAPVYTDSYSGTRRFIGYISTFSGGGSYSSYSLAISLTGDLNSANGGDELFTINNIKNHSLGLINGSHLWGSKILTMPHPLNSFNGPVPLNMVNPHSATDDTHKKYGQTYYRMLDINLGNINYNRDLLSIRQYDQLGTDPAIYYHAVYSSPSPYRFYSSAYQLKPNTGSSNFTLYGKTNTIDKHSALDERGHVSVMGSNLTDSAIFNRTSEFNRYKLGSLSSFLRREFESIDNSALRNFLYITSDLLPYSSLRKDSIFNKNINQYNLFLLENNNESDGSNAFGNRIKLSDFNFQTISFQNKDISSLTKFSMMRLTEVGYDFLFNAFNVENKTISKKSSTNSKRQNFNFGFAQNYVSVGVIHESNTATEHATNANKIIFQVNATIAHDTALYDSEGHYIGKTSNTGSHTGTTHTLQVDFQYKKGKVMPSGIIYSYTAGDSDYYGHGSKNSFTTLDSYLHYQKATIIPEGGSAHNTSHYGETQGDAFDLNGADLAIPSGFELALPIVLEASTIQTSNVESSASRVISTYFAGSAAYKHQLAVCLDRYDIEDGGLNKLEAGLVTPVLDSILSFNIGTQEVIGLSLVSATNSDGTVLGKQHFKNYKNPRLASGATSYPNSSNYADSIPFNADGMFMGLKLRLWVDSGNQSNSDLASSNGNLKKYIFDTSTENKFLEFCDLTGCYLISEKGENLEGTSFTGTETFAHSMEGAKPDEIIYIVSHEIDPSSETNNILVTDTQLTVNTAYRIMQPNPVFMWDFTPNDITPYLCSSKYTKMANENKTYDVKTSYSVKDGKGQSDNIDAVSGEGYLSMYVTIDPDGANEKLVKRSYSVVVPENSYFISDGINKQKINISQTSREGLLGDKNTLSFSEITKFMGVVSISETFTLSSNQELKISPTRACIGSTVSLGLEGEDLINELLEQEGIEFTTTPTDTPMYLAPNYQGVDLYSAIRYILDRKNMKIIEENDVFKIIPTDDSSITTNIIIDDSDKYLISEFEKVSTLFDFYNEIIIYGSSHKSSRKDLRSIKKRGRKTLEVVDNTLITQDEVNLKATQLLTIHSRLNQKLSLTMHSKGINQLRVGDIIRVYLPRENIEMSEFIVLEMEHQLTGFIKLQLGRYSKDLSDVFSELLISSKETKAALRSDDFNTNEVSFSFFNTVDTKELKLLVRKRTTSGAGATLGFGGTLGFSSTLGFTGGASISITDLLEEDLA